MRIFIGSSSEATDLLDKIAVIVQECEKEPIKWNRRPSIFKASKSILENLEEIPARENIDASIFICTADDKTDYRGKEIKTPRDNVIFEHGLFSGKLGRQKSVIVKSGNVTLPNDIEGIIYFDFSSGKDAGGESDLKQWLNELKNEKTNSINPQNLITSRLCVHPEELECTRKRIQQKLDNIMTSGVIDVFESQSKAVDDYNDKTDKSDLPIKILSIRGESFVSDEPDEWGYVFDANRRIIAILSNYNNENLIRKRYKSSKKNGETEQDFVDRYKIAMKATQDTLTRKQHNELYLHNENDFSYRMLFIDDILYLSTFQADIKASRLKVIKIQKGSDLYSICEDYFSKIKENAERQ